MPVPKPPLGCGWARGASRVTCEICGSVYRLSGKSSHNKTKTHVAAALRSPGQLSQCFQTQLW
eukprot:10406111-Lingulodinium_polyedra.AAC.1